jgi:hypothetical protein
VEFPVAEELSFFHNILSCPRKRALESQRVILRVKDPKKEPERATGHTILDSGYGDCSIQMCFNRDKKDRESTIIAFPAL